MNTNIPHPIRTSALILSLGLLLGGCATTEQMWTSMTDGLSSMQLSMGGEEVAETAGTQPTYTPSTDAMDAPAMNGALRPGGTEQSYSMDRGRTFEAAVKAARSVDWQLETARMEDPYIVALPKATLFRAQEPVYIHVSPAMGGTNVRVQTESGEPYGSFGEFFAEMNRQLAY